MAKIVFMKQDRSNWTVRKVTFAEADRLDDEYYAGLSPVERLELLMDLRSMLPSSTSKIQPVVTKRSIYESEEV